MMRPIDTEDYKNCTIELHHDEDCSSPRENDNLGTIATWHRRYQLGDVQPKVDPEEYLESLPADALILPVYMYEHSGIALRTRSFGDPWDSGQLGVIWMSAESIAENWGTLPEARLLAQKGLEAEIEEYSMYVNGECYGYIVKGPDGEPIDDGSCWGFIGSEYCLEEARRVIDFHLRNVEQARQEQLEMADGA